MFPFTNAHLKFLLILFGFLSPGSGSGYVFWLWVLSRRALITDPDPEGHWIRIRIQKGIEKGSESRRALNTNPDHCLWDGKYRLGNELGFDLAVVQGPDRGSWHDTEDEGQLLLCHQQPGGHAVLLTQSSPEEHGIHPPLCLHRYYTVYCSNKFAVCVLLAQSNKCHALLLLRGLFDWNWSVP